MEKKLIDALIAEREGLLRRGKADRVKQIDALLKSAQTVIDGVVEAATAEPVVETAKKPAVRKRTTK